MIKSQGLRKSKSDENIVYVNSDKYFNDPDSYQFYSEFMDVRPVDVFGGFVPQNKSLDNIKKCEKAIQERFNLEKPE